jgi:hypothetical protein
MALNENLNDNSNLNENIDHMIFLARKQILSIGGYKVKYSK